LYTTLLLLVLFFVQAERAFITSQTSRRSYSDELLKLENELIRIRLEMEKFSRSDDAYLELFKTEHDLVKKEKFARLELIKQDEIERELFSSLQIALRESQEKEKLRVERTKYWSIIGSVVGALAGMIGRSLFFILSYSSFFDFKGATISNRYRMQEFRDITRESQKLYEDLIAKQELSINELKVDLSSKDLRLFNEEIEDRLQSKLTFHTSVMIISTSVLSLIIVYIFNR
jgi:hypothetical protein